MLFYILKRSLIALKQKKKLFIIPAVLLVLFVLYSLIGFSHYKIESLVVFNENITGEDLDDISKRKAWSEMISWGGSQSAFIVRNVDSLPEDIRVELSEEFRQDKGVVRNQRQVEVLARNAVKRLVNIKIDADNFSFTITYYGLSRELGIKLVSFYAGKIIAKLKEGVNNTINSLEQNREKLKLIRSTNYLQKIADVEKNIEVYRNMHKYVSSGSHSTPKVISRSSPQSKGASGRILLAALFLFGLSAFVVITMEFMSKTLLTEVQIARYLEMPVIGSLPKIDSLIKKK